MNDKQLYRLCKNYGTRALRARWKFAGLLPEVDRRKLYAKKGYGSIFEFAAKLCGMSQDQVSLALNLEKRFEFCPELKSLLVSGRASMNKLARVVSIATPENDAELAARVTGMSKNGLITLIRDARFEHQNGSSKAKNVHKSLPGQTDGSAVDELGLCADVKEKLLMLKRRGIDINVMLIGLLEKRDQEIEMEKIEIMLDQETKEDVKVLSELWGEKILPAKPSRYIPVGTRRLMANEFGTKCAIAHCGKLSENLHHTDRFAMSRRHDPHYLAPLCKAHHEIAHQVDAQVMGKRTF